MNNTTTKAAETVKKAGTPRGICKMDDQTNLTEVVETKNIVKTATGAETDGVDVDVNSLVSCLLYTSRCV